MYSDATNLLKMKNTQYERGCFKLNTSYTAKRKRTNVSVDRELREWFEDYKEMNGVTLSGVLNAALRELKIRDENRKELMKKNIYV